MDSGAHQGHRARLGQSGVLREDHLKKIFEMADASVAFNNRLAA
jgi:hypothetical protein